MPPVAEGLPRVSGARRRAGPRSAFADPLQHALGDRVDGLWVKRPPPFQRHVDILDPEGQIIHLHLGVQGPAGDARWRPLSSDWPTSTPLCAFRASRFNGDTTGTPLPMPLGPGCHRSKYFRPVFEIFPQPSIVRCAGTARRGGLDTGNTAIRRLGTSGPDLALRGAVPGPLRRTSMIGGAATSSSTMSALPLEADVETLGRLGCL